MGLKVLVVEDEAIVRFDISEHLSTQGFEVLEAENSEEGFSILVGGRVQHSGKSARHRVPGHRH